MHGSTAIRCLDVSLSFPGNTSTVQALRQVNFDVRAGEFLSIAGPSGCGKTSLLRLLAGRIQPQEGIVERPGSPRILSVSQEHNLFPWMTVLENAAFGLEAEGMPKPEREIRARRLLRRLGLEGREHAYPCQLSLGMKQRVAVARCFLREPDILLMDEPFAALDCLTRLTLQQELLELWGQNCNTVVFVTHDVEEAILLSDRILVLSAHPGTIAAEVAVPFPRPRETDVIFDEEFVCLKRRLLMHLGIAAGGVRYAT